MSFIAVNVFGSMASSMRIRAAVALSMQAALDGSRVLLTERGSSKLSLLLPGSLLASGETKLFTVDGVPDNRLVIALPARDGLTDDTFAELACDCDLVVISHADIGDANKPEHADNKVLVGGYDGKLLHDFVDLAMHLPQPMVTIAAVPDPRPRFYDKTIRKACAKVTVLDANTCELPLFNFTTIMSPQQAQNDKLWHASAQALARLDYSKKHKVEQKPDPQLREKARLVDGSDIETNIKLETVPAASITVQPSNGKQPPTAKMDQANIAAADSYQEPLPNYATQASKQRNEEITELQKDWDATAQKHDTLNQLRANNQKVKEQSLKEQVTAAKKATAKQQQLAEDLNQQVLQEETAYAERLVAVKQQHADEKADVKLKRAAAREIREATLAQELQPPKAEPEQPVAVTVATTVELPDTSTQQAQAAQVEPVITKEEQSTKSVATIATIATQPATPAPVTPPQDTTTGTPTVVISPKAQDGEPAVTTKLAVQAKPVTQAVADTSQPASVAKSVPATKQPQPVAPVAPVNQQKTFAAPAIKDVVIPPASNTPSPQTSPASATTSTTRKTITEAPTATTSATLHTKTPAKNFAAEQAVIAQATATTTKPDTTTDLSPNQRLLRMASSEVQNSQDPKDLADQHLTALKQTGLLNSQSKHKSQGTQLLINTAAMGKHLSHSNAEQLLKEIRYTGARPNLDKTQDIQKQFQELDAWHRQLSLTNKYQGGRMVALLSAFVLAKWSSNSVIAKVCIEFATENIVMEDSIVLDLLLLWYDGAVELTHHYIAKHKHAEASKCILPLINTLAKSKSLFLQHKNLDQPEATFNMYLTGVAIVAAKAEEINPKQNQETVTSMRNMAKSIEKDLPAQLHAAIYMDIKQEVINDATTTSETQAKVVATRKAFDDL